MAVEITINDAELSAAFAKLGAAGVDPAPVMRSVGRELLARVQLGFRSGRAPGGMPWAPLKTRSGQPLRDTRRLQNSMQFRVDATAPGTARLVLGTNVFYAPFHQFGAIIKPVKAKLLRFRIEGGRVVYTKGPVVLPARPFLPTDSLPPAWREAILSRVSAALAAAAKGASDAA